MNSQINKTNEVIQDVYSKKMIEQVLGKQLLRMTARVEYLRQQSMEKRFNKKKVWGANLSVLTKETKEKPLIVRKALAFKMVMSEMPIEIEEGELIVGKVRMGSIGTGQLMPEYTTSEENKLAAKNKTSPYSVWGHYMPDYYGFLSNGFAGISKDVNTKLKEIEQKKGVDLEKKNFYEAVKICIDGVEVLCQRYRVLALELAGKEKSDSLRIEELLKIARICEIVPKNPPKSFHEALQALWFIHMSLHSTLNLVPLGRFDQYMFRFLANDMEKGSLSLDEAQELLDCLWIKFNDRAQNRLLTEDHLDPYAYSFGGAEVAKNIDKPILHQHWLQNITLGGENSEGEDASNLLTYICLNATEKLHMTDPHIVVRFSKTSPSLLLERTCKLLQKGWGIPTIFGDDTIVHALQKFGISKTDARNYSADGCWEVLIPGKTELRFSMISGISCLENALNQGYSRITGERGGIKTKDPYTFTSFEEVMEAVQSQLTFEIKRTMDMIIQYYGCLYDIAPVPFLSSLIDGCLQEGKDITQGGARYLIHGMYLMGLSHMADSLAAIRMLSFEEKVVEFPQLIRALEDNFMGREDLRKFLITRVPKFGNDLDYVDDLARQILDYFAHVIIEYQRGHDNTKIRFSPGAGTFESHVVTGRLVGATPDGRFAKVPISSNLSPSLGMATKGPTAAVNSFTKLNLIDLPAGSPLDLGMDGNAFQGEKGLNILMAFVKSFLDKRGNMLTINLTSAQELREAQREPDKHRDLIVHVAGWQAYFTDLSPEHQEAIIKKVDKSEI